jgi:hypothetical protein
MRSDFKLFFKRRFPFSESIIRPIISRLFIPVMDRQRLLLSTLAGAVLFIIVLVVVVVVVHPLPILSGPLKDYELKVESTSDSDKGFYSVNGGAIITSKVEIENSGRKPLADVQVNYMNTVRCEQPVQIDNIPDSLGSDLTKATDTTEEEEKKEARSLFQDSFRSIKAS